MKIFKDIPDNIWDEGAECLVWLGDDEYVYKAYKKIKFITDLQRRLEILNSLPEYEKEEIYGMIPSKNIYITRQKKLRDWEQIFVDYFLSEHRRLKDWKPIIKNFMVSNGYERYGRNGWKKNDVIINDIDVANIGMTENNEIKIIDASLLYNGMYISKSST